MAALVTPQTIRVETFVEGEGIHQVPKGAITAYPIWLTTWLNDLSPTLSPINAYEVSLRLTNDAEIQRLNTDYRQQAKPTDVLSFASLETDLPGATALYAEQPLYLGDIVISIETAARQASTSGHSLTQETAWLTAHGLLHLLGWDHPDEPSLVQMLDRQDQLLKLVDFA